MNKASIYIKHPDNKGVYLHTQKMGTALPKILHRALIRGRERWGDTPTLTRIIFSEMTQSNVLEKNGFAISTTLMDNEQWLLVVDDREEKIGIFGESGSCYKMFSLNEFCGLKEADCEWNRLIGGRFNDDNGINRNKPDLYPFISIR